MLTRLEALNCQGLDVHDGLNGPRRVDPDANKCVTSCDRRAVVIFFWTPPVLDPNFDTGAGPSFYIRGLFVYVAEVIWLSAPVGFLVSRLKTII